jgi:hypothetical protein
LAQLSFTIEVAFLENSFMNNFIGEAELFEKLFGKIASHVDQRRKNHNGM